MHGLLARPQLPSGRDLDQPELHALVGAVAADPAGWRDHVRFPEGARHYSCLHRDEHIDVWLLCWTPGNDTGWHDHDQSSGAVAVVRGALLEHSLLIGRPHQARTVAAGAAYSFGPEHIHRLTGQAPRSVSIHAYSPPLLRLGQYSVDSNGVLRRNSISYADELRAFEQAG